MKQLALDDLLAVLSYDKESGLFTWKINRGSRGIAGAIAGMFDPSNGYVRLKVKGRVYLAHRLAWLYVHGQMPKGEIDHLNGKKFDNRIENLRDCSRSENNKNSRLSRRSTSGVKGVSFNKRRGTWEAYITVEKKRRHLGSFSELEEARRVRESATMAHFGSHVRLQ